MASAGKPESPQDRVKQIRELVEHFQQCRRAGKPIAAESLIVGHPRLMPELQDELRKAEIVADAADEAILQQWSSAEGRMSEDTVSFELQEGAEVGQVTADLQSPQQGGRASSSAPAQIGKYSVIRLLDRGGQTDVYLAVDPILQRQVVIKVSHTRLPGGSASHEQLLRQGRLVTQLQHPNLDRVYELGFHDEHPFLVMEYVRGLNLVQHARQKPLAPAESAALVAKLGHALAAAHEQGIIHRDVKPNNVVIGDDGAPRLIDFGMASVRDAWSSGSGTEEGISGTPEYMAPEQARGEAIDHRSDVFALGAVLYFLLAGKAPFSAETRSESWRRARACDFDRSAIRDRRIPRTLRKICLRAMEASPNDRYATASEMAKDLEAFSGRWKLSLGLSIGMNQWKVNVALTVGLVLLVAVVAPFVLWSTTPPIPAGLPSPDVSRAAQRIDLDVSPGTQRPPWQDAWTAADARAKALVEGQRFGEAEELYRALAMRFEDPDLKSRVQDALVAVREQAETAYGEIESQARQLLAEGKFADARAALRPAIELHHVPASSRAAKELLSEIDDAESLARALAQPSHRRGGVHHVNLAAPPQDRAAAQDFEQRLSEATVLDLLVTQTQTDDPSIRARLKNELKRRRPTYTEVRDQLAEISKLAGSEDEDVAEAARDQLVNAFQRAPMPHCLYWLGKEDQQLCALIWEQIDRRIARADSDRRAEYGKTALAVLGHSQFNTASRGAALDLLARLNDRQAAGEVIEQLSELPRELWPKAGELLHALTGEDFGPRPGDGVVQAIQAQKHWQAWSREHRD